MNPDTPADPPSACEPGARDIAPALGRLVETIGQSGLGTASLGFLRTLAGFDSALVLSYQQSRRPRVLAEALAHPLRSNAVDAYLDGAYLLDPFRTHAQSLREPALVRLRDITSRDFRSSEYFRTYYMASHLIDEVNFLIPLLDSRTIAVGMGRSQASAAFSEPELVRFRIWLPVVSAVFRQHMKVLDARGESDADVEADHEHGRLERRLARFGSRTLTRREHEVVQHLLRGRSAPFIAAELRLSLQTVRVHRRNIYDKLSVSSLGQLFALAMHSLLNDEG